MQLAQEDEVAKGMGSRLPAVQKVDRQGQGRRYEPCEDGGVEKLQDGVGGTLASGRGVAFFGFDNFDNFSG